MSGKDIKQQFNPYSLTPRQVEILNYMKLGLGDKQIASKLGTSKSVVSNRISHGILPRLGALNRAHAVFLGLKRKIIDFDVRF